MSYPSGWDLVNVTGTYIGKNGVPCVGSVTFSSPQLVLRSGTVVPAADIVFELNSSGAFSGQVPATDDPNAQPSGWLYSVTENVPGGRQGILIAAPHTSPGIDMSTVVPVTMPVPPSFQYPLATLQQLASQVTPTGASLIGYTGETVQAFLDSIQAAGSTTGSAIIGFEQNGANAVTRNAQSKLQEITSAKDDGALGNGVADDGAKIVNAFSDYQETFFPAGSYINASASINLPFSKTAKFSSGADIVTSGTGTTVYQGVVIREGYNPDGMTFTSYTSKSNYVGLNIDMNGYGKTSFSGNAYVVGVVGAVNIPSGATTGGWGIAGYAKSYATGGATAAVGVYGEGNAEATNALAWGLNTRTQDNGFSTNLWGAEIDINLTNVSSTARGIDVTGGSTVEPSVSEAYRVGPLGAFASPPKRWQRGFFSDDGAAITALEIGAATPAGTAGGMQPVTGYYINGSLARTKCLTITGDSSGNLSLLGGAPGALCALGSQDNSTQIKMINGGGLAFFGSTPVTRPTASGNASITANTGTAVLAGSTFTGGVGSTAYTIGDIVAALKKLGLITS